MVSIAFPNIFQNNRTVLYEEHKATASNLLLMLKSHKTGLFGDPYFGTNLKRLLFEQGDVILKDIIIDDIYTSILNFMPQVYCKRENIYVIIEDDQVSVEIKCVNRLNYDVDLYTINLTTGEIQ